MDQIPPIDASTVVTTFDKILARLDEIQAVLEPVGEVFAMLKANPMFNAFVAPSGDGMPFHFGE